MSSSHSKSNSVFRRRGFTLVELLVVIAIIGVLVALLLPAVQAAREAARRMQCTNNLKQVGLASHSFESAKQGFPMAPYNPTFAWMRDRPFTQPNGWPVQLLPYMEQENVRDKYDYNSAWGSAANQNVIDKFIPSYVCPSAPNWASRGIPNGRAPLDYIAFFSVDPANTFINPVPIADQTGQGVMGRGVNRTFGEILDGSSNTILLAEDAGRNQVWIKRKLYPAAPGNALTTGGAWGNCCLGGSVNWFYGFNLATLSYYGPTAVNGTNASQIYGFHPGGANVVMADGSVHFLAETVDINVVVALLTRANGEVLPAGAIQ